MNVPFGVPVVPPQMSLNWLPDLTSSLSIVQTPDQPQSTRATALPAISKSAYVRPLRVGARLTWNEYKLPCWKVVTLTPVGPKGLLPDFWMKVEPLSNTTELGALGAVPAPKG